MENYRILSVIGEGTYGKVFKAQSKIDCRVVAIKKFKQDEDEDPHVRKTMVREIKVLKEFRHDNIVNLRDVFREKGKLFLIFDHVEKTLLEELQESPNGLDMPKIKEIIYQILQANHFLHTNNIIHRDIKPENLLISKSGVVKLCDFGFARPMRRDEGYCYTDYVSTRWYRAPELLVGDAAYNESVDIWAIGCIFAEIYNGMPLFPGDSDLHTLQLILETITADDMDNNHPIQELSKKQRIAFRMNPLFDGMKAPLASEAVKYPEHTKEVSLQALLKNIDDESIDFIRKCLVIDGSVRCKTSELLNHPFFDKEFRNNFESKLQMMQEEDVLEEKRLMQVRLFTKDGEDELDPELVFKQSEKEESSRDDEDDEDDDEDFEEDESSTPLSSSGVGRNEKQSNCIQTDISDQYKRRSGNQKEINGDLADVELTHGIYKSRTKKNSPTDRLANQASSGNYGSSGIHGSSGIAYDSEDYYQAVNLQIDTSETAKQDEEFGPMESPQPFNQIKPESIEIFNNKLTHKTQLKPTIQEPEGQNKRLSINHFKIESSITEEIKEEQHSDQSSIHGNQQFLFKENIDQNQFYQDNLLIQSDSKTFASPKFPNSNTVVLMSGPDGSRMPRFQLPVESQITQQDSDEIGAHLKQKALKANEVPITIIQSYSKLPHLMEQSQSSISKFGQILGDQVKANTQKISKVNITFGPNATLKLIKPQDLSNEISQVYAETAFESNQTLQKTQLKTKSIDQKLFTPRDITPMKNLQSNSKLNFGGIITGNAFQSQNKPQPTYQFVHPNSQQQAPSWKQQAILKQTSSLEKFKVGAQGLPNLKFIHSSLSQYNQQLEEKQQNYQNQERKIQNVLLSSQQFNAQSLQIRNQQPQSFTQPRHVNGHPKFQATSQEQMDFNNQSNLRQPKSQYNQNQQMPNFSPIGKNTFAQVLFPRLQSEEVEQAFGLKAIQMDTVSNRNQLIALQVKNQIQFTPQQTQKQKLYDLSPQKQMYSESQVYNKNMYLKQMQLQQYPTSYSRSTNPLNEGQTNNTVILNKQITVQKDQILKPQVLPKRYAESELKYSQRTQMENNHADEYMMQQENFHPNFGQMEMAQRPSIRSNNEQPQYQPKQGLQTGTSLISCKQKSAVVVTGFAKANINTSMIMMNQNPVLKTEQKPANKFIQSFQNHNPIQSINNTLVINHKTSIGGALSSNGFHQNQTFEKASFPRRNITNKLRNAQNTQPKINKFITRGGSMNESNQIVILPVSSSPKSNIVILPNLQNQQSGQQGKQFPPTPHKVPLGSQNSQQYQNSQQPSTGEANRSNFSQKQNKIPLQPQTQELNIKMSSKNANHQQQQIMRKPVQNQKVIQYQGQYQMYKPASYNSGTTSLVGGGVKANVIKPIGSENQLKKLSEQKLITVQFNQGKKGQSPAIASPKSKKLQTDVNWNQQQYKEHFQNDRHVKASNSIYHNKVSQDFGISPLRVDQSNVNPMNSNVQQQGQQQYISRLNNLLQPRLQNR